MTGKYGDYGAGPQEARPLEWGELADSEKDLLGSIHARLNDICNAVAKRQAPKVPDPWAQMEHDPRGRVMVVHGERGSGKTTLLVTLLHQMYRARLDPADDPVPGGVAKRVRPLAILDFDPLPEGLPLHAWLVQAWLPLVEYLESQPRGSCTPATLDDDPFPPATLREEWDKLFERAIIGWADVHDGRPIVDRLFDHREQLSDYQTLPANWCAFVDHVFDRLEQTPDDDAVAILVPVDDVDLQVQRNSELIHATRLLRHPRVVYLITADLIHTRDVVLLNYQSQHRKAAGLAVSSGMAPEDRFQLDRCSNLADALMKKAFPDTHVFETSPVHLQLLLVLRHSAVRNVLNELTVGDELVGNWLIARSEGPTGSNEPLMQWRDVQRIFDGLRHRVGSGQDKAAYVLKEILAQRDAKGSVTVISGQRHGAVVDFALAGELRVSAVHGWYTGTPNRRIVVGTELKTRFVAPDGRLLNAPSALLARELHEATEDPDTGTQKKGTGRRGPVQADRTILAIGTVLAWTHWTSAPRNAFFLWPFARFPKIPLLRLWLRDWDDITGRIRDVQNPDEKLAYAWVCCQLQWCKRPMSVPAPNWEEVLDDSAWTALLKAAAELGQTDKDFHYWYERSLPLFATPEVGLPEAVQERILNAVVQSVVGRKPTKDQIRRWIESFDPPSTKDDERHPRGERHQCVMNALYAVWDESGEDKDTEPTDAEGDQLLEQARRLYPDAPWYRMRNPPARKG